MSSIAIAVQSYRGSGDNRPLLVTVDHYAIGDFWPKVRFPVPSDPTSMRT